MKTLPLLLTLALIAVSAHADTGAPPPERFQQVGGPCDLRFPEAHGPHPAYRTEWWYYTGNLTDAGGRDFGFQFTIFRSGLRPPQARRDWPDPASAWRSDQLFLAHLALTDIASGRHHQAERMLRPVLGLAGAQWVGDTVNLYLGDWRIAIAPEGHRLEADAGEFALRLDLTPQKPPVLHGDGGYSRKGSGPQRASCYYSFTRLQVRGSLTLAAEEHSVRGTAWMDHEFSTAPLEAGITGWDWFSLQLSDGSEVMVYLLRQADGGVHPASSGTYVGPGGDTMGLQREEIGIQALRHWTSPHTGARYPIRWRVTIAPLELMLTVAARVADQEMRTPQTTAVDYWEGSVGISGSRRGVSLKGVGYVELTGYAEPFDAPM